MVFIKNAFGDVVRINLASSTRPQYDDDNDNNNSSWTWELSWCISFNECIPT